MYKQLVLLVIFVIIRRSEEYSAWSRIESDLLQLHKEYRKNLTVCHFINQPQAKNFDDLYWSYDLAKLASEYAAKCNQALKGFQADTMRSVSVAKGEDMKKVVEGWFNQYKRYNYDQNRCSGNCDAYINIARQDTRAIGCAAHKCSNGQQNVVCYYQKNKATNSKYVYEENKSCPRGNSNKPKPSRPSRPKKPKPKKPRPGPKKPKRPRPGTNPPNPNPKGPRPGPTQPYPEPNRPSPNEPERPDRDYTPNRSKNSCCCKCY